MNLFYFLFIYFFVFVFFIFLYKTGQQAKHARNLIVLRSHAFLCNQAAPNKNECKLLWGHATVNLLLEYDGYFFGHGNFVIYKIFLINLILKTITCLNLIIQKQF